MKKERKIYINLVPIKTGGGLQNAINLLLGISQIEQNLDKYKIIIRSNKLEDICKKNKLNYKKINDNDLSRIFYEIFYYLNKKDNLIFTLFGGKPLFTYKNFTITGCAYSNLFYPDVDFWEHLPYHKIIYKKVKDFFRFLLTKSSDVVIFETNQLRNRAISIYNFPVCDTYVVKTAVNKIVEESKENAKNIKYLENLKNKFKILYLASSHPNKRQHLLLNIAKELKKRNENICFITTMEKNNYSTKILKKVNKDKLNSHFKNIGPIEHGKIGSVIKECQAMINIAKLESFSNNFIEAWTFNKLLLLTDHEWAREICDDAAIYLSPEKPKLSANKIIKIINNPNEINRIIKKYDKIISKYPDYKEKTKKYLKIIQSYKR